MEIRKDRGKEFAITLTIVAPDRHLIDCDASGRRLIQAGQNFKKSRFSTSVSAGNENRFTPGEFEVERLQGKRGLSTFVAVAEGEAVATEPIERKRALSRREGIRQT